MKKKLTKAKFESREYLLHSPNRGFGKGDLGRVYSVFTVDLPPVEVSGYSIFGICYCKGLLILRVKEKSA